MMWEYYLDESYYGMYAVRKQGDGDFNSELLFHIASQAEAERLMNFLNSVERKLDMKMSSYC